MLLMLQSQRLGIFADPVAALLERHGLVKALQIEGDISVPGFGLVKLKERELSASAELVYNVFATTRNP